MALKIEIEIEIEIEIKIEIEIELEPTGEIETVTGAKCRKWKGTSNAGADVFAWVAMAWISWRHPNSTESSKPRCVIEVERQVVSVDNRFVVP